MKRQEKIKELWKEANEILEAPEEVKEEFEEMIKNTIIVNQFNERYPNPTIKALMHWMAKNADNDEKEDEIWDYFEAEEFDHILG